MARSEWLPLLWPIVEFAPVLIRNPDTDITRILLAAAYGYLGSLEAAHAEWGQALKINPHYSIEHKRQVLPYKYAAQFERITDGLRKAGLPPDGSVGERSSPEMGEETSSTPGDSS